MQDIRANPRRERLRGPDDAERFPDWSPWTATVGNRIRAVRKLRGMSLWDLAEVIVIKGRPQGFGPSYLSELERGRGTAPLYALEAIAAALALRPGELLGSDDIDKPFSDAELALLRTLQRLEISPDEAMARIARADRRGPS